MLGARPGVPLLGAGAAPRTQQRPTAPRSQLLGPPPGRASVAVESHLGNSGSPLVLRGCAVTVPFRKKPQALSWSTKPSVMQRALSVPRLLAGQTFNASFTHCVILCSAQASIRAAKSTRQQVCLHTFIPGGTSWLELQRYNPC